MLGAPKEISHSVHGHLRRNDLHITGHHLIDF